MLEIAAIIVEYDDNSELQISESHSAHVIPFKNAELDESALKFNRIDPFHPFRMAIDEKDALELLFKPIRHALNATNAPAPFWSGTTPLSTLRS